MKRLTTIISMFLLLACSTFGFAENQFSIFGGKTVKASNRYVTKDIRVSNFNKIELSGSPDVIYRQKAGKPSVEVYTSDNIVDLLDIYVKDGTLVVKFKKGVRVSYNKLEIRVSSERINDIRIAGSGDIKLAGHIKTDDMNISIAGSGDINGENISSTGGFKVSIAGSGDTELNNIHSNDLSLPIAGSGDMKINNAVTSGSTDVAIAGSGTVKLSGSSQEAELKISGSGDLYASGYQAKRVSATVSGSGNIECYATEFLKARTSGSGSVGYKGNPEIDYPKKGLHKL